MSLRGATASSLLLMAAVVGIFILPVGATCSGCGCYTSCPTEAEKEQFLWMKEAICFLYSDDCCRPTVAPQYFGLSAGTSADASAGTSAGTSAVTPAAASIPASVATSASKSAAASASAVQPWENGTAAYYLNKANELYLAGSYSQAAESYSKAVEIDPSLQDAWLNMGNALFFMNRYEESLNAYDSVLKLNPQNENAWLGKSKALSALNRTEEAGAALGVVEKLQGRKIAEVGGSKSNAGAVVEPVVVGSG